jgi:hypothetical protein
MEIGDPIRKVTTPASLDEFEGFLHAPLSKGRRDDQFIRINISRNTLIAIVFSLLIHALILFLVVPHLQFDNTSAPLPTAMEVSLAPPKPPEVIIPTVKPLEVPIQKPVTKRKVTKVITQKPSHDSKPPTFSVPNVIATPQPTPEITPLKENAKDAPTDMASYVKARQAQRQASEADAAKQNAEAVAREIGPSQEQIRDAIIKRNLQHGENGFFEWTIINSRHANFTFRGWTNDYSNARRESFEVEASTGQDVRLVMIKKMIVLIRQHYQGDFHWDSQRQGRVVTQSARPEDNAALEDFMMTEFFGSNYKNAL